MKNKDKKFFFSAPEVARITGFSRMTIVNKIKKGEIKAEKVGRNYIIPAEGIKHLLNKDLSQKDKEIISKAVKKTIKEYGEAIRMLGKE